MCDSVHDLPPPAPPNPPERDARGHFAPGNRVGSRTWFPPGNWARLEHGLQTRTDRWPPELEALAREVDDFLAQALLDDGDPAHVPARRRALLSYRARLHRRILQLDAILELRGLVDKRGKLRAAWLQRLEGLIAAARAIDSLLGLERRQKPVPSLREYLETRPPPASTSPSRQPVAGEAGPPHEGDAA